jgi:hypothetical protein
VEEVKGRSHELLVSEVRMWNLKTREQRLLLRGSGLKEALNDLTLNLDSTRLATAHDAGTVKVWSVRELLKQAPSSR